MDNMSYETPDGTWYISFPFREARGFENHTGQYIELSNNYTTIVYGNHRSHRLKQIQKSHTFLSSVKYYLVKMTPLITHLIDIYTVSQYQDNLYSASILFDTLVHMGSNCDDLVPHILHKKEIDEKERTNQELSRQLSLLRIGVQENQKVIDANQLVFRRIHKQLDEKNARIKYLVEEETKTSDELEELKEKYKHISRYRKTEIRAIPQRYPTYEQELETACRRAKEMARQQKEAKERLTMIQHDYDTIVLARS